MSGSGPLRAVERTYGRFTVGPMLNKVIPLGLLAVLFIVAARQVMGPGGETQTEVFPSSTTPEESSTIPKTSSVELPDVTLVDFDSRVTASFGNTQTRAGSTSTSTSTSSSSSSAPSSSSSSSSSSSTSSSVIITLPTITITLPTIETTVSSSTSSTPTTKRTTTTRPTTEPTAPPPSDNGGDGDN